MQNSINYFKGKKIVIMGLGLLGGALNDAIYLLKCGANLIITDMKSSSELRPSLKKLGKYKNIKYVLGRHDLEDFKQADFILQPGNVPVDSPYLLEAKKNNIPVHESESLFMEYAKNIKVIGITGTRGKSTTTALIYEILKEAFGLPGQGKKVHLAGNVKGLSTLALLDKVRPGDMVVLELDSWCLHGIGEIKKSPQIAIFTNLMPDHLNFYLKGLSTKLEVNQQEAEAMQKYFMDKAQIFANQTEEDYLILDAEIKKIIDERYKGKIRSHIILIKDNPEIRQWKIKIKGEHNFKHILRAVEVAKALGVDMKLIKKAVENFGGVEGRQQLIKEYKGIKIYNDTTATTPEATMAALQALSPSSGTPQDKIKTRRIVLILGGEDKNIDTAQLLKEIPKYCKVVFLLAGSGSDKIKTLNLKPKTFRCENLKKAVVGAVKACQKGDILLFSPAFASFGLFKNEYDRGEQFVRIIKNLK